jgi:hypothetical protein
MYTRHYHREIAKPLRKPKKQKNLRASAKA